MRIESAYLKQAAQIVPDIAAILTSTIAISMVFWFGKLIVSSDDIKLSDLTGMAGTLASAGAIVAAVWIYTRTQAFNESAAYLQNSIALINKARDVLTRTDGLPTNDRISWVTAARLIKRSEQIASRMSVDAHRILYEAEHDYQRHIFGDLLTWSGQPLSASFFCGASDPSESIGVTVTDEKHASDGANWIPENIIAVVFRFFQFPEGYADPLNSQDRFSQRELDRLWLFGNRGAHDYVTFRKHFFAVRRNVFRFASENTKRKVANAFEIDQTVQSLSGVTE